MSKLAHLIAEEEGYGKPGALPTRNNNPGDLRHSPHSFHYGDPNAVGVIDTPEHGWEDLETQLQLYAKRGLTLRQAICRFAPPTENNTLGYLSYICKGLGVSPDMKIVDALKIGAQPVMNTPAHATYASAGIGAMVAVILSWLCIAVLKVPMPPEVSSAVGGLVAAGMGYFLHNLGDPK